MTADGPRGRLHVTAVPILDGATSLGFVAIVHDVGYIERRNQTANRYLWLAFGILSISATVLTLIGTRITWRGWTGELRRLLHGGVERPEFRPLLRDVQDLIDRISSEREMDGQGGTWNAQRLRDTLKRYFLGERLVILANREPYVHVRTDRGVTVLHPASGLVTALEPVMRACSGVWVAHGSGSADRETAGRDGRLQVPPGDPSYVLRRIWLSTEEERGYYYGFANEGLWPLCHTAHTRPAFRRDDWLQYRRVNQRFAAAVEDEVDSADPIVLVQDYHFALAPALIQQRLPRASVLTFWHIPWPNSESLGICPWRCELLEGLLGSRILGFQTESHVNNFLDAVDTFLEARIDREERAVVYQQHETQVRAYPISVEWPPRWPQALPSVSECRQQVIAQLDLPPACLIGVGVDRLDYTKGIEERLLAVERLLERDPALRGRFVFIQLAAPSRTAIDRYQQLDRNVEAATDRINQRFRTDGWRPIVLLCDHHEPMTVFRFYRAADVCYVSSLHDGMNLVAKEFVAARDDEQGVLVLSRFTGAARELTEALIVNPYDLEESSAALLAALEMPESEQRERMSAMRSFVAESTVYRWVGRMLLDGERLRRRDRLRTRLEAVEPAGVEAVVSGTLRS